MIRRNGSLSVCSVITFLILFWSNADATNSARKEVHASKIEGLSIEFDKGRLSVDIKDVDAKVVFKALGEKGKIEIVNQRILPDRRISLKFKDLEVEEGLKKLMRVAGVTNHSAIHESGPKPDETVLTKLILIKAEPRGVGTPEAQKKDARLTVPVDKKREGLGEAMDKAQAEAIMEPILPMLEAEGDEQTAREIMKELMEGETHPIDD